MPAGARPGPPGSATDRNKRAHPWRRAEGEGWQHGKRPSPPSGLSAAGKRAWQTWLSAWWASFYSPEDLPGLELAAKLFDGCQSGLVDVSKVVPLMDRYGITPKGRQDLRWARAEPEPDVEVADTDDEFTARREARGRKLA